MYVIQREIQTKEYSKIYGLTTEAKEIELHKLYEIVAEMRENNTICIESLSEIYEKLKNNFKTDWLLPLEIYELMYNSNSKMEAEILNYLTKLKTNKQYTQLINNGLKLIFENN